MSVLGDAQSLLQQGRADEAASLLAPLAEAKDASHESLAAYAQALKGTGRLDAALSIYERAARAYPTSGVAEHNVASVLGDLERHDEAVAHARLAIGKGSDAPETWLVLGRALQSAGRLEEAEAAYRAALQRRPGFYDALRDLAQLIWMRTGDVDAALGPIEGALRTWPTHPALTTLAAKVENYGGRPEAAYRRLSDAARIHAGQSPDLELSASNLAALLDQPEAALAHAENALRLERGNPTAGLLACDAFLGLGRADAAARMAGRLLQMQPDDQEALSRLAVAWRLLGDPRYGDLYEYSAFVQAHTIDTPAGWDDLTSYLADLKAALDRAHGFSTHPYDQSLRGGSQTPADLRSSKDPAIVAFFSAIDGPIHRHMAALGQGADVHRRRNTGDYRIAGAWSVRLKPQGFHIDHIHPMGWLSSACYIEAPPAVDAGGREGWIKFGEPGIRTRPPLPAEHFVKPSPGTLVLFPSYMWHGTVPFSGEATRLTCAFDVVPA